MKRWKKEQEVWRDSSCFLLCCIAVPPGEDHYPWGGGRPRAGGRRGVDPAARHRQDRPQKPSTDAHQRQSNDKHMCIKFLLRNAPLFFKILQLTNPLALVQLSSLPMLLNLSVFLIKYIPTLFVLSSTTESSHEPSTVCFHGFDY